MSDNNLLEKCTLCGEKLVSEARKTTYKYLGIPYTYTQMGQWCNECGEGFFSPHDLKVTREIRDKKRNIIKKILNGTFEITHQGFTAKVCFDTEADVFYGEIINSGAIIHSKGKDIMQLEESFREGVEEYLRAQQEIDND